MSDQDQNQNQNPNPNLDAVVAINKMAGELVRQKKYSAAKIALCRALSAMPDNYELWANLSSIMWSLHAYEDSKQCAVNSLNFNKDEPHTRISALISLANCHMSLGDYDQATTRLNEAIECENDEHKADDARWNKSLISLLLGNYPDGWEQHGLRFNRPGRPTKEVNTPAKRWTGESLTFESILLVHDQGAGDTIMFSRYLECLTSLNGLCLEVYLQIPVDMFSLFSGWQQYGVKLVPLGEALTPCLPKTDYYCFMGDLPAVLKTTLEDIPRLSPVIRECVEKAISEEWNTRISIPNPKVQPSLKVGICWQGGAAHPRDDIRNIPLRLLASLAENPRIWLYSLQVGKPAEQIRELGLEPFIMDLSSQIEEKGWIGTATAIQQLDVIVTCDTSVAHLSGSLGKTTLLVIPTEPYWPWGSYGNVTTPWYPSMRIFRQIDYGNWAYPVEEVRRYLERLLSA